MLETKIIQKIDDLHLSHYWYGGVCAEIKHKGYTATVEAVGDVYAEHIPSGRYVKDKNNAGRFYNEMNDCIKNDKELYKSIDNGDLDISNNNWWECYITDPNGNFHDIMWCLDANYLPDAIEEVKKSLDEMIAYIEED